MIYNLNPSKHATHSIRIGFFGGTFDPPHNGHLLIAQKAIDELGLEEVNFAPARVPPHKQNDRITAIEHRIEMVRLAIQGKPRFVLSYIDVDREGPVFSVDSIRILRDGWHESTEIYFLMGMDSLAGILSWHQPQQLIKLCRLAAFARAGANVDLSALDRRLPGLSERTVLVNMEPVPISASEIQRRVRTGESIKELVPASVEEYIRSNHLYMENP